MIEVGRGEGEKEEKVDDIRSDMNDENFLRVCRFLKVKREIKFI